MLADGDRASNGDVWLRILTSEGQITKGKLHHAAFKGTIKPIHADKNRPWSSEMSGRLRSLAGSIDDIKNHATAYCARKSQKYSGVAFGRCADLKINFPNSPVSSAVHYTPIDKPPDTDRAHADLTFSGAIVQPKSAEEGQLLLILHGRFTALHPDQIGLLPEAAPEGLLRRLKNRLSRLFSRSVLSTVRI